MDNGPDSGEEMEREDAEAEEAPDLLEALMPDLDLLLAMLLFSRRVHVDNFALGKGGRAKLDLSGEGINDGLSLLMHAMSYGNARIAEKRAMRQQVHQEKEEKEEESFWKALRDFALPPR